MAAFLEVNDELRRTLGFLPDDESLDEQSSEGMGSILKAAELYVQNAIGKTIVFIKAMKLSLCINWHAMQSLQTGLITQVQHLLAQQQCH